MYSTWTKLQQQYFFGVIKTIVVKWFCLYEHISNYKPQTKQHLILLETHYEAKSNGKEIIIYLIFIKMYRHNTEHPV